MKNVNASSTVSFPVKTVTAAFVSPDFFKSMGLKATITGETGTKYKIGNMSGTIFANSKNKMLIRSLRFDTMGKDEPDAVSVFTYTASEDGTATTIDITLVNIPDTLAVEMKGKLKDTFTALKQFLAAPAPAKAAPAKAGVKKAAGTLSPAANTAEKPKTKAAGTAKRPKAKKPIEE